MTAKQNRHRYGLTNPIIFAGVMEDQGICKELIERILPGKKVKELNLVKEEDDDLPGWQVETEKSLIIGPEAKSVRLDVLFEGDEEWYDIEMQVENRGNLPRRTRHYHAVKTVKSLKRGQDYDDLKPGYVIFICMFDLFGLDAAVYRFEMCDTDKKGLKLNDGQVTIFLNGTCKNQVPEVLEPFYRYLQTGEANADDALVNMMDFAVAAMNQSEEVRFKVTLYDEAMGFKLEADRYKAEIERNKEETEALKAEVDRNKAKAEELKAEAAQSKAETEQLKALTEKLLELNRIDDLKLALKDENARQNFLEELKL